LGSLQLRRLLGAIQAIQQRRQVLANGHRQRMGDALDLEARFQRLLIEVNCLLVPSLSLSQARALVKRALLDGGHHGGLCIDLQDTLKERLCLGVATLLPQTGTQDHQIFH
jgi:hypothetical protein